jgi:hypothetical protein
MGKRALEKGTSHTAHKAEKVEGLLPALNNNLMQK